MSGFTKSCLVWSGCVTMILSGCGGGRPQVVHPDVLAKAALQYYWRLDLELRKGESLTRLDRVDENLYCLTSEPRLIAIDASRGLMKWSFDVRSFGKVVFTPTHADGLEIARKVPGIKEILSPGISPKVKAFDAVLVNTLSYVLVLDRQSGEMYRSIPFDFAASTSGTSDGMHFYAGSTKGWYYAILLNEAIKDWWRSGRDMITVPVKYHAGRIYVADDSGMIYASDVADRGEKVWTRQLNGPVTAEFHVDERGCFVPCDDHRLYALDLDTGRGLWDRPFLCQGPLRDPVQVAENTIFQFARRDRFYAINLADGRARWSIPEGREVLAVIDGEVFVLTSSNSLLLINEILGTVKTSLPMTGWNLFVRNTSIPVIYVASGDGRVGCIRELSAGRLTSEALRRD